MTSERKESSDGDGRGRGDSDGDGGGCSQGKEGREGAFVFGSVGPTDHNKVVKGKAYVQETWRPISLSYKEKLLAPGGLGSCEDDGMEDEKTSQYPVLSMTAEQYTAWCRPWMNSLVIKVLGLSVLKHVLIDRVRRMWKPQQPLKVVPLSNEYYIISFSSKEDRDYAYHEGPWMIDDHYLLVQRWRPNFNPWRADCQRRIAVWVRIPNLPMELCTVESLGMIGNMIGKMIKIDRSMSIYDKGLHLVCFECGLYGHERKGFPHRKEVELSGNDGGPRQEPKQGAEAQKQSVGTTRIASGVECQRSCKPSGGNIHAKASIADEGGNGLNSKLDVEGPTAEQVVSGGSKHLGPHMIFRRDLWRSNQSVAANEGLKRGITENMHGVNKVAANQDVSHKEGKVFEKEHVVAGSMGGVKKNFKQLEKKAEWVVVGSKRKKEEKIKRYGKENNGEARSKAKLKGVVNSGAHPIDVTNPFSHLQNLDPSNVVVPFTDVTSLIENSVDSSPSLTHGINNQISFTYNTDGTGSVEMEVSDMGMEGKEGEKSDMENEKGCGLTPTTTSTL
ncbi:hypothetical protein K1719_026126 [Acacia pycnantha]|nr:hypothetical protein K1719_026126 [Acacia pycnantha]